MRRKDREMDADFAYMVVDKCEWAVLAMIDETGMPYNIPITIVRDKENIYFHSAKEGRKIQCLRNHPEVSLTCVGNTKIIENEFTTKFESAIIQGVAEEVTEDEEKIHGLRLLCLRHAPSNMDDFDSAIDRSLFRTAVWRIQVKEISGKRKK